MRRAMGLMAVVALFGSAVVARADEPKHDFFATSDEVNIHYMTLGDHGSWVVLIHGYTGSAEGNWFRNGIAELLAKNHRVVAIDCRNHGRSDKPTPGGPGIAQDVLELMDHLHIEKAHIHGYSMGGSITGQILAIAPERVITAAFGGSGIRETDPELAAKDAAMDAEGTDPEEAAASRALRIRNAMDNGMTQEEAEAAADAPREPRTRPAATSGGGATQVRRAETIDLKTLDIPILAIVGEYDRPYSRTNHMQRDAKNFKRVILPGKSHLTAIAHPYIPKEYGETLSAFIDANDPK